MDDKEKIIEFIIPKIIKTLKPRKIILFGSYIKGNYKKHSDIDIAVETDLPLSYFEFPGNFDIIDLKRIKKDFKEKIFKEGKIIYERKN